MRAMTSVRPISARQAMLQVRGMRPNARLVHGGGGWIVMDGDEELSATAGGYVATTEEAWLIALEYAMRRYREGLWP